MSLIATEIAITTVWQVFEALQLVSLNNALWTLLAGLCYWLKTLQAFFVPTISLGST